MSILRRLSPVFLPPILLFLGFAVAVLAAELVLRAARLAPPDVVTPEMFGQIQAMYDRPSASFVWSGRIGQRIEFRNVVKTNSLHLHDAEHTKEKQEGTYRILFLGDSFVEALQVPLEDTFFRMLEARLNEDPPAFLGGKKAEVIAIGRSGAGAMQETVDLLSIGLSYSPDFVVALLLDQNDFKDDLFYTARTNRLKTRSRHADFWSDPALKELKFLRRLIVLESSYLNRWLAYGLYEVSRRKRTDRELREAYETDLLIFEKHRSGTGEMARIWENAFRITASRHVAMKKLLETRGIGYAAVLIDNPFSYDNARQKAVYRILPRFEGRLDFTLPRDRLKELFRNQGTRFVDLNPVFEEAFHNGKRMHFRWDGHWNKEGHRLAAAAIEEALRRL